MRGTVLSVGCPGASFGSHVVTVYNEDRIDGEVWGGYHEEPCLIHGLGKLFAEGIFEGVSLGLRVKSNDVSVSEADFGIGWLTRKCG